jgi:hypothetical protein
MNPPYTYELPRHNPPRYRWSYRAQRWLLVGLRFNHDDPPRELR